MHTYHTLRVTLCLLVSIKLTMYTVVNSVSMGFLYRQAETQNISKFTCHSVLLLLNNPSLVEEPF